MFDAEESTIFDQASLNKAWSSILEYLQTQPVTERFVTKLLKSGVLQTKTGETLAPLFEAAIKRSIKASPEGPQATVQELHRFVECIIGLPSERWIDTLGENVNFPRGGLHGYLQSELTNARVKQQEKIIAGEMIDDGTWSELRDFIRSARAYIPLNAAGELNECLSRLEDYFEVRPPLEESMNLVDWFLRALCKPGANALDAWGNGFATAQRLSDRIHAIQDADKPGTKSLHEILSDPEFRSAISNESTLPYFQFDSSSRAAITYKSTLSISRLISLIKEIDNKSSFYEQVQTDGPHRPEDAKQTFTYAVHAMGVGNGLISTRNIEKPARLPDTAVGFPVDGAQTCWNLAHPEYRGETQSPAKPRAAKEADEKRSDAASPAGSSALEPIDLNAPPSQWQGVVSQRQAEVDTYIESVKPESGVGPDGPVRPDIENKPSPLAAETNPETLIQSILDVLSQIEDPLKFPSASAHEIELLVRKTEEHLAGLDELEAQTQNLLPQSPVDSDTVQSAPSPSWWEAIAPVMHGMLTRLSSRLATYGGQALGQLNAVAHLAKDNPGKTAAIAITGATLTSLWALHDKLAKLFAYPLPLEPVAVNTPPTFEPEVTHHEVDIQFSSTESPALHQEHLEDELLEIVSANVTRGQPPLSQSILELMYRSTEHNLLDDAQLIDAVAQLLKQHTLEDPGKTFVDLILEAQIDAPVLNTTAAPIALRRVERDVGFVDLNEMHGDAPAVAADAVESEPSPIALLAEYLKVMDELQRSDIDAEKELKNDDSEDRATQSARQVVQLLRKRRNVTWMDASRAAGDRQLVVDYAAALTTYADSRENYGSVKVAIPMHSSFGRCWLNVVSAFKNPFFIEWAAQAKLDLTTAKVSTADNTLTGMVNGIRTTFKLDDNTGWAKVAGPILRAVKVVDPTYIGVNYPASASIPLALVSGFYGENTTPDRAQARVRASELTASQAFPDVKPDDPLRPAESRSEAQLEKQRQLLGDLYTYHSLKAAFSSLLENQPDDATVDLGAFRLIPHKDSLFAIKHSQEAQRMVDARRFISAMGWTLPKTVGDVRNLIDVLTFALPEPVVRANYQGALGYPRPLTSAQLETIRSTVQRFQTTTTGGLLNELLQHQSVTSPVQGLNRALSIDKAKQLGQALELNLDTLSTPQSATEWVMAALLLDLDATPGLPRNHVAGYNLTQAGNWGAKPSTVVSRLETHLIATGKVTATTAPVAAYHLLAGTAPEFLVRNMPDNLVCGSHTWTTLRIAVARIEQLDPGASVRMTFEQVMAYGNTAPITVGQDIAMQSASVNPLMDWAIANGVVAQNVSDTYTNAQLDIAREKFNDVRMEMARARDYLTTEVPTRESLALAELERVFGKGLPFNERCFRRKAIPQGVSDLAYSLLDLYITGQLKAGIWNSYNAQISTVEVEKKLKQLKPVETFFKETFTAYFDNLRHGSASVFKYLVSQLPLEDRQSLEYGRQKFYSVRSATDVDRYSQTPEMIEAHKGRHGILIRSEYQQKVTYYEVFPSSGQIRKNPDLPEALKLNGEIKTFSTWNDVSRKVDKQCATSQFVDWEAYEKGTVPRNGVTSEVIIEEITPVPQEAVFYSVGYNFDKVPNAFSGNSRVKHLASVVVDKHFVVGREKLESFARGSTDSENEKALMTSIKDFFLSLVPFKSCIENIVQGNVRGATLDCTLDAAGFVIPGIGAAGKAASVATSGARFIPKALKMTWIMSSSLVSSANPFDGVGDLFRFGKNVVCKLGTETYRAAGAGLEQIKSLYGTTKAVDHQQLLRRADIAQGTVRTGVPEQNGPVTALFKDGKWYAFDVDGNRPYGPPLENFRPASSIPLQPATFSDGSSALTNSRLFDTEPHTIQRLSGEVDVVVGDNVYRFNPEQPQTLTDLTSPAFSGELAGFDAVCSSGGKSKRGVTCLSKYIGITAKEDQQRAQALEHKRLWPSKGTNSRVVHERRIFNFDGVKGQAHAAPTTTPLEFKAETTGSIINDKYFGFLAAQVDDKIEQSTFTVRVNSIVNGIDDMRDVRAFKVDIPGVIYGKYEYLVAEVDAGLFYYCRYDKNNINNIKFTKIDFAKTGLAADLINGYHKLKDPFLVAGSGAPSRPFMALPTLETLYNTLIDKKGYTPDQITNIKEKIELFSDEHKREFLITVWKEEKIMDIEAFITPIHLNTVEKPTNFNDLSDYSKNMFYAQTAQTEVNRQLKATGLRSANQQIPDDPNDVRRFEQATSVILWEYSRLGKPNYAESILRTGAGNCDQMAHITASVVIQNGGSASLWKGPGHAFTLVGMPMDVYHSTIDFSEPIFDNVQFVDAWLGVRCPASRAMEAVVDRAREMLSEGIKIRENGQWIDVIDSKWLDAFVSGTKQTNMKKTS